MRWLPWMESIDQVRRILLLGQFEDQSRTSQWTKLWNVRHNYRFSERISFQCEIGHCPLNFVWSTFNFRNWNYCLSIICCERKYIVNKRNTHDTNRAQWTEHIDHQIFIHFSAINTYTFCLRGRVYYFLIEAEFQKDSINLIVGIFSIFTSQKSTTQDMSILIECLQIVFSKFLRFWSEMRC